MTSIPVAPRTPVAPGLARIAADTARARGPLERQRDAPGLRPGAVGASPARRPAGPSENLVLFAFASTVLLALSAVLAFRYHYYFGDALSRAFAAASVLSAGGPNLANLGFIWPPIPGLVQVPFAAVPPLLATGFTPNIPTALFAAGALVVLNEILRPWLPERRLRWAVLAAYQTNPMILLYSINGMSEQIMLFFTLASVLLLRETLTAERSVQAYVNGSVMGLAAGAAFLTRYEGLALGLALGLLLATAPLLQHRWRTPLELEAALLSYAAPLAYTIFMWLFANWLIMGNPLYFLVGRGSNQQQAVEFLQGNPTLAGLVGNVGGAAEYVVRVLLAVYPAVFLALALLVWRLVARRDAVAYALAALLGSFPLFQLALHVSGQSFGWTRFQIYVIPLSVVGLVYATQGLRRGWSTARPALLVLALVASSLVTALSFSRTDIVQVDEPRLLGVIRLTELGRQDEVDPAATRAPERTLGGVLRDLPAGRILADEIRADHAIVFSGDASRFLTTRSREFEAALDRPEAYVRYLLVPGPQPGLDLVGDRRPELFSRGGPGLRLLGEWPGTDVPRWRLYEVVAAPEPGRASQREPPAASRPAVWRDGRRGA